jgi:hypothetical protein
MRGLRKTDRLIVVIPVTIAFAILMCAFYPHVSKFDQWPDAMRIGAEQVFLCLLAFAAGYFLACKRSLSFRLRNP